MPESRSCIVHRRSWGAIGFQGMDPRTDLNRSQGMLTLLQV
ncbi:unnamed protein product, partial [Phaeothamnion confervicola]